MGDKLTDYQKDALKELGNIGAGSAATALSQMLGKDIGLDIPKVSIVDVTKIAEATGRKETIVAAVYLRIFGEIKARALIVFPQDRVLFLIDLLMKRNIGETKEFGETEQSALKEIGNIIISAYLNSISKFIGLNAVPSVPALAVDMIESIFEAISAEMAEMGTEALLIENEMSESVTKTKADLILIPDKGAMEKIIKALDDAVKGA
ncbi:MAG TPA: chemotaxis protein CheC [bacterium]|nr:chemotaxis protein CheC [bacterium]